MADPSQIGALDAATAGTLGSYALIGVLIGALTCGSIGDYVGRRRIILVGIAWFSIGMFVTSLATSIFAFGALRLITGIGLGAILATAGATIAEFAPAGRRNFYNAVVYSGIPAGGVLAALLGMILLEPLGWRGLFMIGATPAKTGFGAVFSSQFRVGALLLGFMSFSGLLLTYGLNTWLPKIMEGYGYGKTYSLAFLLVLMTFHFPLPVLFMFIAVAGVGTQVLIYGFTSNYFTTNARAAGVAWCSGFGRLGGIFGPLIGGWLVAAGLGGATAFYIFGGVALFGALVTMLVPRQKAVEAAKEKAEEILESTDHQDTNIASTVLN